MLTFAPFPRWKLSLMHLNLSPYFHQCQLKVWLLPLAHLFPVVVQWMVAYCDCENAFRHQLPQLPSSLACCDVGSWSCRRLCNQRWQTIMQIQMNEKKHGVSLFSNVQREDQTQYDGLLLQPIGSPWISHLLTSFTSSNSAGGLGVVRLLTCSWAGEPNKWANILRI